ncbi:hypothetical protein [Spiroplasma endosymbiont of Aspidapion aeneum]|uniref:hypothetical protein n=1 Tax=Spiroplasma endosymbiont of Aspidapion aeneum TaxID=3066276 RepID=UPI00313C1B7D
MNNKCNRCLKESNTIRNIYFADKTFNFRFSNIKEVDNYREYYICKICSIKLNNYFNPLLIYIKLILYLFFASALAFFAVSIYLFDAYGLLSFIWLSFVWLFLSGLILPISPVHKHKYYQSKWNANKLYIWYKSQNFDNFDKLSNKNKQIWTKKEFDIIYLADYICHSNINTIDPFE